MKYPAYSFTNLMSRMSELMNEASLVNTLDQPNHWFEVSQEQYKEFIDSWSGEPLSAVQAHNIYAWGGNTTYYIYTTESRRILAKICPDNKYYLALNA